MAPGIVGSWIGITAGEPGRTPGTPSLYTFTSDGTVLLTASTPGSKAGHGVWVGTGDRDVAVTIYVIFRGADDQFIGTAKVRYALTLNAAFDEYAGSATREVFDAHGKLQQSSDITVRATRIKVG